MIISFIYVPLEKLNSLWAFWILDFGFWIAGKWTSTVNAARHDRNPESAIQNKKG
jgi:hypothetical protein